MLRRNLFPARSKTKGHKDTSFELIGQGNLALFGAPLLGGLSAKHKIIFVDQGLLGPRTYGLKFQAIQKKYFGLCRVSNQGQLFFFIILLYRDTVSRTTQGYKFLAVRTKQFLVLVGSTFGGLVAPYSFFQQVTFLLAQGLTAVGFNLIRDKQLFGQFAEPLAPFPNETWEPLGRQNDLSSILRQQNIPRIIMFSFFYYKLSYNQLMIFIIFVLPSGALGVMSSPMACFSGRFDYFNKNNYLKILIKFRVVEGQGLGCKIGCRRRACCPPVTFDSLKAHQPFQFLIERSSFKVAMNPLFYTN